jgi:hypothetical protein
MSASSRSNRLRRPWDELIGGAREALRSFLTFAEMFLLRRPVPWHEDAAQRVRGSDSYGGSLGLLHPWVDVIAGGEDGMATSTSTASAPSENEG